MPQGASEAAEGKKYKINPFLWVIPLILSGIGILLITSTTSPGSFLHTGAPFQTGVKQIKWFGFALAAAVFSACIPTKYWKKYSKHIYVVMWVLAFCPLIPGFGQAIGGARRWIKIPGAGMSIQPGELLCVAVALRLACKLSSSEAEQDSLKSFISTLMLFIISIIPLMLQPDFGTIVLVFLVCMGMYVERVGWKQPLILGGIAVPLAALAIIIEPYRMRRIYAFLDPWADPLNKGFQAIQGLIAFANGGLTGMGLGHGFQKLNYLPAAYTDFIYAAIGEELGLVGTLCVLGLFLFWALQTRQTYFRTSDDFKASLIWGITLTVIMPMFINVAGVIKMIPMTGMALPFITYGGSSLVTMWARVGIVLSIERESRDD